MATKPGIYPILLISIPYIGPVVLIHINDYSARSLEYALFLFAMHPEVQEEIFEEMDGILEGVGNIYDLKYEEVFPKMVKTNGVLVRNKLPRENEDSKSEELMLPCF